jgi:hypothetical protein
MTNLAQLQRILNSIVHHVSTSDIPAFDSWRIAMTNDAQIFYREWNRPARFISWEVDDLNTAWKIEFFFTNIKGMIGGITGELDGNAPIAICIYPRPRP